MEALLLALAFVILAFFYLHSRGPATSGGSGSKSKHRRLSLPPSPWRLPWIGNLHQLGPLPHRSLRDLSRRHGPVMLLQLGSKPMLVVSSPEAAKEVLKTHDVVFASRPLMVMAKHLLYGQRDLVFAPLGEGWRQGRKICMVHVLCAKRVQSYSQVIKEEVAIMLQKIAKESKSGPINLSMILNNLTFTIISRIVLGRAYASQDDGGGNDVCALVEEMSALFGLFPVDDFFPGLGWLSTVSGITSRARTCFRNIDKFLEGVLEDHRQRKHDHMDVDEDNHEDLVDLLLSMQRDQVDGAYLSEEFIKPLLLDLIVAGTDTSFITMEWSMAELARNQRLLAKAKEEINGSSSSKETMISDGEAASMAYIDAVVKESLRLHPPSPLLLPREATEEAMVLGYTVPSGSRVMVNMWAIGRDAKYWEEPLEYRPERFLDSAVDFKGQDFQFLPFGSGRRMCPGSPLAMAILRVALSNLIKMFDWEIAGGELDMEEAPGMSTRRKVPLVVTATPCFDVGNGIGSP